MSPRKSTRKLLKLKYELDSLDHKTKRMRVALQQFEVDLRQFRADLYSMRKMKGEVGQPFATNEVSNDHDNEVNFDLPPKFDEYEEREEEKDQEEIIEEVVVDDQSACEAFLVLDRPQKCQLEQEVQSLFFNGSCHEVQEVDWNSPPNFDTYEEQKDDDDQRACESFIILGSPQKFESNQVEITQGFEQYLIQEECHHRQQELRTILFQQGEYDGYLIGYPTQPCEKNSLEVTSCQIPTLVGLFSSPLFEFHDKRHFMEFFLNFKVPLLMRYMRVLRNSKEAKEVHNLARKMLKQSNSALGS